MPKVESFKNWNVTPLAKIEADLSSVAAIIGRWNDDPKLHENDEPSLAQHLAPLHARLCSQLGQFEFFARDFAPAFDRFMDDNEWHSNPLGETDQRRLSAVVNDAMLKLESAKTDKLSRKNVTPLQSLSFNYDLQVLESMCARAAERTTTTEVAEEYDRYRFGLLHNQPYFLPITVILCRSIYEYDEALDRVADAKGRRRNFVSAEFQEIYNLLMIEREESEPATVQSSSWTGRRSLTVQVQLIRAFAPIVLDSLHELIGLHERLGSNSEPLPEQAEALALLGQLHRDIGELLATVEAGKPHTMIADRVRAIGARLFSLGSDTKDLLILGAPTVVATGLTLGVVKGLEYLCGFDLPVTETAALVTVAGGGFALHDVAPRSAAKDR